MLAFFVLYAVMVPSMFTLYLIWGHKFAWSALAAIAWPPVFVYWILWIIYSIFA